ncbi:hypothetical protein GCM10010201_05370 [Pilimelia columellifera subsp. columellifera]|uniref:Transposase n=1 Tax=Pilimelia columellifera subsp. columellifera TaxID=706583 RepID=A0ABN3N1P1_9ACTN
MGAFNPPVAGPASSPDADHRVVRCSPQDKPVERIWAALKEHIANTASAIMADRIRQAQTFLPQPHHHQNLTTAAP